MSAVEGGNLELGKAGVLDAETLAAEPGRSVVEPASRVRHPGTQARIAEAMVRVRGEHEFWPANGRDQREHRCSCAAIYLRIETEADHDRHVADRQAAAVLAYLDGRQP